MLFRPNADMVRPVGEEHTHSFPARRDNVNNLDKPRKAGIQRQPVEDNVLILWL